MVIRRIGVLSAAKIGAALGAGFGLLAGIMVFLISLLGMGGMGGSEGASGVAMMGGMGILAVAVMPIIYGIVGFIGGALQSFLFNLAARFVGGLEIDTE